jgi:hypothetical protein
MRKREPQKPLPFRVEDLREAIEGARQSIKNSSFYLERVEEILKSKEFKTLREAANEPAD